MAKNRNKNRNKLTAPPPKRRKLDEGFENIANPPEKQPREEKV